jgi:fluoride exporter
MPEVTWVHSLIVFFGAGAGGCLRFWLGSLVSSRSDSDFPWGTLAVNLVGSLAIGLVAHLAARHHWPASWRLLLAVGLLGGFTTFSAFSHETLRLIENRQVGAAGIYVLGSVAASVALCAVGIALGRAASP